MSTKTEKTFTVAGIAAGNGIFKVKFANSVDRVKQLTRAGFTDIRLASLPYAMQKRDAVLVIRGMEEFSDDLAQNLFDEFLAENPGPVVATATETSNEGDTPAETVAETPTEEPKKSTRARGKKSKAAAPVKVVEPTDEDEDEFEDYYAGNIMTLADELEAGYDVA